MCAYNFAEHTNMLTVMDGCTRRLLDRFGKQHRYDFPIRDLSQPYWKTALVASSVCIASSLSDDSAVHAASSKSGGGDKSGSDMFEEIKQKLAELSNESLAGLQKLVPDEYKDLQKQLNDFLESGKGGQVSWGFAMGVCSGFALKKMSKVGALALGALFVLMQCASYSGYIDVNYKQLERDVMNLLDINKVCLCANGMFVALMTTLIAVRVRVCICGCSGRTVRLEGCGRGVQAGDEGARVQSAGRQRLRRGLPHRVPVGVKRPFLRLSCSVFPIQESKLKLISR